MRRFLPLLALLGLLPAEAAEPAELWLYWSGNLWVDRNIERLEEVLRRAVRAGYDHALLADSKFAKLGDMDERYRANLRRVRKCADSLGIEIVPALFSIGYSNDLLWHDPNLAEGLPVRGSLFVVRGGVARLEPDPPVSFREKFDWKDDCVTIEGGVASVSPHPGNARMVQALRVSPYRCYHVAVKVRTEEFTGEPRVQVLAQGRSLQYENLRVARTQEWKEHHVVFNSLGNTEVVVYFGNWGGAGGRLQWKEWRIEEVGLLNVLRREGAPLEVEGHVEGRDFEPIEDPRMGVVPWKGGYEAWHEPPVIRTKLPDGTRLRVNWYHPAILHDGQVCVCPSEQETMELLADQARRMREAWEARGYMMSHDEIRTWNQDLACERRRLDAGPMLAENARACRRLLAGATAYVWSDMFDPFHNAHGDYYLARGDFKGSWEGLDRDVVIVNWNYGKRDESLRFFAGRGHRQLIAGYYDTGPDQIRAWLESAKGVEGVIGVMYTTWRGAYDDLEAFAKSAGR